MLDSRVAVKLADWCIEHYDKYGVAPYQDIHSIYKEKLKQGKIRREIGDAIEQDILPYLNEQYVENGINAEFLANRTKDYYREQRIRKHLQDIETDLDKGKVENAEKLALSYKPIANERADELDLRSPELKNRLKFAFEKTSEPVLWYPGALGDMWNEHLVRGGFVGIMAGEKVGKTLVLLDMAVRAMRQGTSVAFFQAGDMTEDQQLMRLAIYLTKRSNKEQYTGEMIEPIPDCIWNQLDECDYPERECDHGIFNSIKDDYEDYFKWKKYGMTKQDLMDKQKRFPDYRACHNCVEWHRKPWGSVWIDKVNVDKPLEYQEAVNAAEEFLADNDGKFKLVTYANGTLSVPEIDTRLSIWQQEEGFTPGMILVDYADLLISLDFSDFRHKQNDIWAKLRGLSQKWNALVVTPTQADAKAYETGLLRLSNFSEDKRKYSHVTYMTGLNRDPKGREKELGIMRVNDLVAREGWFTAERQVTVLQNLRRGRPFLGSFW
jgi:hypothetical protein